MADAHRGFDSSPLKFGTGYAHIAFNDAGESIGVYGALGPSAAPIDSAPYVPPAPSTPSTPAKPDAAAPLPSP